MKKIAKTPILRLTEKFDRQLLKILNYELQALKETQNMLVKSLRAKSGDDLLVA